MKNVSPAALAHGAILVFGGPSEERLVSLASAQNVLAQCPIPLEPWFIDRDLGVHIVDSARVLAHTNPFTSEFDPGFDTALSLSEALATQSPHRPFFICMHGTWGEDGSFQQQLESHGLAFTASTSPGCRMAFDKARAKAALAAAGHLVPHSIALPQHGTWPDILGKIFEEHGPFVLKPDRNGSSIGLHIVRDQQALLQLAAECSGAKDLETVVQSAHVGVAGLPQDYIAETLVVGREFTVGVIETGEGTRALPISEVRLDHSASFDYQGKYLGRNSTEITPADIDEKRAAQLSTIALDAHRICGCRGYSRTDIILSASGPVFLEINTHPGLTKASFIPQQLAAAGLSFPGFLETQLLLSVNQLSRAAAGSE